LWGVGVVASGAAGGVASCSQLQLAASSCCAVSNVNV
jgi:hypothetical protein